MEWIAECDKIYNKCVNLFNSSPSTFDLKYTKNKLVFFRNYMAIKINHYRMTWLRMKLKLFVLMYILHELI